MKNGLSSVILKSKRKRGAGVGVGLVQAHNASADKEEEVLQGLRAVATAQRAMRETLLRMPERCDPYIYYNRVRPALR